MIRCKMSDPSRPVINNLFIDVNALMYRAVSESKLTDELPNAEFLASFFRCLDLIVQICEPTDLVFIAVDGVPPSMKVNDQRRGRYKMSVTLGPWQLNSGAIIPGTKCKFWMARS